MTVITVPATYRDGALHPITKLNLPEGAIVEVQVSELPTVAEDSQVPGDSQAVLRHAGTFRLDPGELDHILAEIAQLRELDQDHRA